MTVAKTVEISSESATSFDDAIKVGVERANQTLRNVRGAWVKDQQVVVENGQVTKYRVAMKVTFLLG